MTTSAPAARNSTVALIACFALSLAAIWWLAVPGAKDESPTLNAQNPPTSIAAPAKHAATTSATLSSLISSEDSAVINSLFAQIKVVRRQVEAQNSRRLKTTEDENEVDEHVLVPSLTTEQLDPIYTALTEAGKTFTEGTAASIAFRKRADEFVAEILRYPTRLARKSFKKSDGTVSYGLGFFGGKTELKDEADGSFSLSGGELR